MAKRAAGFNLRSVQNGLDPADWKPLQQVGPGVKEIRFILRVNGESFMLLYSRRLFTSCMPSGRKLGKRAKRIWISLGGDTNKWRKFMNKKVVESSGNVFLDLGFSPEDSAILQMRSDLMSKIRQTIKRKSLTQSKAAEMLGITQSRVSDLIRGKWERFSLEMLITLATKAGIRVTLKTAA